MLAFVILKLVVEREKKLRDVKIKNFEFKSSSFKLIRAMLGN